MSKHTLTQTQHVIKVKLSVIKRDGVRENEERRNHPLRKWGEVGDSEITQTEERIFFVKTIYTISSIWGLFWFDSRQHLSHSLLDTQCDLGEHHSDKWHESCHTCDTVCWLDQWRKKNVSEINLELQNVSYDVSICYLKIRFWWQLLYFFVKVCLV